MISRVIIAFQFQVRILLVDVAFFFSQNLNQGLFIEAYNLLVKSN